MGKSKGTFYKSNSATHKVCTKCGIKRERSGFHKDSSRVDGIGAYCKECRLKITNQWREENPEKINKQSIWDKRDKVYGITKEQYFKIIERQKEKCGICKAFIDESSAVNHNHETGIVRGILCRQCNSGLGMFKDNIESLKAAIKYLKL